MGPGGRGCRVGLTWGIEAVAPDPAVGTPPGELLLGGPFTPPVGLELTGEGGGGGATMEADWAFRVGLGGLGGGPGGPGGNCGAIGLKGPVGGLKGLPLALLPLFCFKLVSGGKLSGLALSWPLMFTLMLPKNPGACRVSDSMKKFGRGTPPAPPEGSNALRTKEHCVLQMLSRLTAS